MLQINFQEFIEQFTQKEYSGGLWTTAGNRLLLLGLAISMQANDILELGYDAGITTEVFAMTGARVVGVDNLSEYGGTEPKAQARLAPYPNCTLHQMDALQFLDQCADASFDLIFVDDNHGKDHVFREAQGIIRILRSGGYAVFHDTIIHKLWEVIDAAFPAEWQRIQLPSVQSRAPHEGKDFGLGIVKKP